MKLSFYLLLLLLGLNCTNSNQPVTQASRPPNIVLIFTDDQGYQDLGCYGSPDIATPHLDQMADEGLRFTNFYVSQPVCSASRASLLTGCYSNRISIHNALMPYVGKGLHPKEETIADILKPQGYATAIFGKWHLGSETEFLPTRQGFDTFFGIPYSNDMWPLHPQQGPVFDFDPLPLFKNETIIDTVEDQTRLTVDYTTHAVDFIKKNKDQPFFLYVPHSQPHVPLFVSEKFKGKSKRGLYGDVISEIDWSTGEILKTLKELALDEHTLVIFTSDNGPWLNYGTHAGSALPLREGKGTALEGGVRVPCIMRWPGVLPAGKVIKKPLMSIDLLPTIAQITGAKLPQKKIDGIEITTLLKTGRQEQPHHEAYFFYYKTNELHAVLSGDGRWKLYLPHQYRSLNGRQGKADGTPIDYDWDNTMGQELYDLQNDLSETKDVATDYPEIVAELLQQAERARTELGDQLTQRRGTEVRPAGLIKQ